MHRRFDKTQLLALTFTLAACAGSTGPESPESLSEPTTLDAVQQGAIEVRVEELMTKARAAEVWITPALTYLTRERGGELEGLENRLKSRSSLTRKLSTRTAEYPDTLLERMLVEDAIRYTIVIEDQPQGHHDRSIHEILAILSGVGHEIGWVKNYWPPGDDYSGVNCVLRAPNGTFWELQFHTPQSLAAKQQTHELYEEYRLDSTPLERKRELFETMTEVWKTVPVPVGILESGSLHASEQIRKDPPP